MRNFETWRGSASTALSNKGYSNDILFEVLIFVILR